MARRTRHRSLRWVDCPAGTCWATGDEEARHEDQYRHEVEPEAQHIEEREHHVARADHQRDHVIAEAAK